jgi:hypothetical protein
VTPSTRPHQALAPAAHLWVLWLLLMALFSLVVALAVAFLESLSGTGLAEAVLSGGAAFGASMGICLAAVAVVRELRRPG